MTANNDVIDYIKKSQENQETFVLSPKDQKISFFFEVLKISNDEMVIKNPIPPIHAPYVMSSSSYTVFFKNFWINIDKIIPSGTNILIKIPLEIHRMQNRIEERTYFSTKDNVYATILHPFDSGTIIKRKVLDLSESGMSIRSRFRTKLMEPGRIFQEIKIYKNDNILIQKKAKVIYLKQIVDLQGMAQFQVGMQFIEESK